MMALVNLMVERWRATFQRPQLVDFTGRMWKTLDPEGREHVRRDCERRRYWRQVRRWLQKQRRAGWDRRARLDLPAFCYQMERHDDDNSAPHNDTTAGPGSDLPAGAPQVDQSATEPERDSATAGMEHDPPGEQHQHQIGGTPQWQDNPAPD